MGEWELKSRYLYFSISPISKHSKRLNKQSEDWLMTTPNPNGYLRDVIGLVTSFCLLCPLYAFVLLLPNNCLNLSRLLLQILSVMSD